MLNPRSPIVNQMIGGGYQQGYPPNNYPIGYNGYTGYYGNVVNYNYYNPIMQQNELRRQQEEAERKHKEEVERMKRMSRIAHAADGSTIDEESLNNIYDPRESQTPDKIASAYEYNKLVSSVQSYEASGLKGDPGLINRANQISQYHNKFIKQDCGLIDFLNSAGGLYVDCLLREERHKNHDLSGTYDSNSYRAALANRQAPYAGKFSNNLDDNVVTLPPHLKQRLDASYEERRSKFIQSIMGAKGAM